MRGHAKEALHMFLVCRKHEETPPKPNNHGIPAYLKINNKPLSIGLTRNKSAARSLETQ